ncbi:heme transporter CcmD [Streptococcus oricebi]|uniref:Heme transporter CcmD n=1 Tax=Streptococcus oricebi TaxID=1547447 RepID=A0ABS5B527_9STRE|nr:heme transporter CcmD [Streptococcus oricebi]MBP2623942.1 heme transporter CcmD [Streptococcus oricebi]
MSDLQQKPEQEKTLSPQEAPKRAEDLGLPLFMMVLWSGLLSILSVANPFLTSLANNLQSQNLYAGWAMSQGQVAYGHFYGNSGLLYYLIDWLGSLFMGQILFAALEFFALLFAGVYLFRLTYLLTGKEKLAQKILPLLYLLVLTLGFGGLYASIFVLPFILWGAYFVARYSHNQTRDKTFILFGAVGALAFMIEPVTSVLFYVLSFIVLTIFNIARKRKARGLYQLLADLFGFSLVFYPLGYLTVWNGSFGFAISQVTYPWDSLSFSHGGLLGNLLLYLGLALALGFFSAIFMALGPSDNKNDWPVRLLAILGLLASLIINILRPDQGAYQLLVSLPFAMILLIFWLNRGFQEAAGRHSRSRRRPSVFRSYFAASFFLPLLAMIYLVVAPLVQTYILEGQETNERSKVALYIKDKAKKSDKIYAWDKTASLYQASGHLSAASILSPSLYLGTSENKIALSNQLGDNGAKYILVNKDVELLDDVKKQLGSNYEEVDLQLSQFQLYQLK